MLQDILQWFDLVSMTHTRWHRVLKTIVHRRWHQSFLLHGTLSKEKQVNHYILLSIFASSCCTCTAWKHSLFHRLSWLSWITCLLNSAWLYFLRFTKEGLSLSWFIFDSSELISFLTSSQSFNSHHPLDSFDVMNMEVDLLLKHDKVFVPFDLQVVFSSLNLGL